MSRAPRTKDRKDGPAEARGPARGLLARLARKAKLPKGSLVLSAFTAVAVALGYVREGVIAYYFGTSAAVDTFLVAFTIPKLLVALVTNVIVLSLLPVYVAHLRAGETVAATDLMQRGLAMLVAVLAVIATVLALAPGPVMAMLAPGFDAAQTAETARLLRGLLPYTVLASAAAMYKVVLDSHQRFWPPAAARVLVTVLVISTVVLVSARIGIWALIVGYALGGVLMFSLHLGGARGLDAVPRLRSLLRRPSVVGLPLAGVGWVALQLMLGQVFSIADRVFASSLEAGSIAALNYATAIITAPQNFVTAVLATTLFPVLARKVADGRARAALREAVKWIAVVWVATLPLIVLIVVFRVEVVALLLERGAFDRSSTGLVASILAVTPLLIAIGGSNTILNRLLLARRNYRFTAGLAGLTGAIKIGLNAVFVGSLGVVGLALASVLTGGLALVLRFVYLWKYGPAAPVPSKTPPARP